MEISKKIEDLIFNTNATSNIEIERNKIVTVSAKSEIMGFTESECRLAAAGGSSYKITGKNLRIKEYSDFYIRVESDNIEEVKIIGVGDGRAPQQS